MRHSTGQTVYCTVTDICKIIESNIEDTTIADTVAATLARFDGKKITRRMAIAVKKALPAYTVHYNTNYGMKQIDVWGNGIAFDSAYRFLLGYDSHAPEFSLERFKTDYSAAYYGAAHERNSRRAEKLNDTVWQTEVAKSINQLNAARLRLRGLLAHPVPDAYDIEQLLLQD